MSNQTVPDNVSFLLRLWKVKTVNGFEWRSLLMNVETQEGEGFSNLQKLFSYLRMVTGSGEENKDKDKFLEKNEDQ